MDHSATLASRAMLLLAASWLSSPAVAALMSIGMNPYTTGLLGPGDSAGVHVQTHWNNLPDASAGYPVALLWQDGNPTGASVTGKVGQVLDNPTPDSGGDYRLMHSGLKMYGTGSEVSMSITNLPSDLTGPGANYRALVYFDMSTNTGWVTYSVTAYDLLGGLLATKFVTVNDAYRVFSGTFEECTGDDIGAVGDSQYDTGNYCVFEGLTSPGVRLAMKTIAGSAATLRGSLNGVQLVQNVIPEPGTGVVLGLAALAVLRRRRPRQTPRATANRQRRNANAGTA